MDLTWWSTVKISWHWHKLSHVMWTKLYQDRLLASGTGRRISSANPIHLFRTKVVMRIWLKTKIKVFFNKREINFGKTETSFSFICNQKRCQCASSVVRIIYSRQSTIGSFRETAHERPFPSIQINSAGGTTASAFTSNVVPFIIIIINSIQHQVPVWHLWPTWWNLKFNSFGCDQVVTRKEIQQAWVEK